MSLYKRRIKIHRRHFRVREKVREQRIKLLLKTGVFFIICVSVLMISLLAGKMIYKFASSMKMFEVRNLEVYGLESVSKEKFFELLPEKYTGNILISYFINFEKFITDRFERINSVKVKRDFFNKRISFMVTERKPIAFKYYHGKKYGIDIENKSFLLTGPDEDLPQIIFESELNYKLQKDMIDLIVLLKNSIEDGRYYFNKFYTDNEGNISFLISNKTKVIWGKFLNQLSGEKIEYLKKILDLFSEGEKSENSEVLPEYIDLRLSESGRVVVKKIQNKGRDIKMK